MRTVDLLIRYTIIIVAWHLACAWIQTFQSPWPLVDAFELADSAEEQLFKSLGVRFDAAIIGSIGYRHQYAYHSAAFIRSATSEAKALGSSTLTPMARTCFVPSRVRTSTGCLVTSHTSAW